MQRTTRRLSGVLLALTLLLLPAAAHAEPAAGGGDRWFVSVLGVLGDLVGGLRTIGTASETTDPLPDDDDDPQVSPSGESDDSSDQLVVGRKLTPQWEPNG
jgi:hypothetical protein